MTLPETSHRLLVQVVLVALLACGASGCATRGPPVQEMSDARQAIAAAREAGAATLDGDDLQKAELQLAEAETQLQQRMYWDARRLALDAKEAAIAALLRSRSLRDAGVPAVPAAPPR